MTIAVKEYMQRPRRAWQADGLSDMAIGLAALCIALMLLDGIYMLLLTQQTQSVLSPEYARANRLNLLVTSFLQLAVAVPFLLIEPLKRRFVYPRSGYMHLRVSPKHRRISYALIMSLIVVSLGCGWTSLSATGFAHFWTTNMTLMCVECGIGLALAINYVKFGFVRHLVVGAISLAVTLGLIATSLDWQHKFLFLSVSVGVSLLIAGAIPFARLLRTPLTTEEAQ